MSEEIKPLLTEEECLARGGHFWNNYDSHGPVNGYGKQITGIRYAVGGPAMHFRKCGFCLKHERNIPGYWEDIG